MSRYTNKAFNKFLIKLLLGIGVAAGGTLAIVLLDTGGSMFSTIGIIASCGVCFLVAINGLNELHASNDIAYCDSRPSQIL
ncbi:MAG: hypothetical protein KAV87_51265 [Desulfobacteraceae bacterium]|nr:hypothetical protein [Desulfobacteraceae bacterium]